MKAVYTWDADKHFNGIKMVEDDYQLADSETFKKPQDGLYEPISWTGTDWVGTPKDVWEANQSKVEVKPTQQQQLNASFTQQMAQLLAANKQQAQLNAKLTIDVAELKAQNKTKEA
jgi:uncharacterized protein YegL